MRDILGLLWKHCLDEIWVSWGTQNGLYNFRHSDIVRSTKRKPIDTINRPQTNESCSTKAEMQDIVWADVSQSDDNQLYGNH